jgi:hypothetical protein
MTMKQSTVLIIIWTLIYITYGNEEIEINEIERNDQYVQFPVDSKLPVTLSINGTIETITNDDTDMIVIIFINSSKNHSIQRCFCEVHSSNTDSILVKTTSHQYKYTLTYEFNSYLLRSILSGDGIRCYVYNDNTLFQFQLVYNNTKAIRYTEPIESKFEMFKVLKETPHMIWLSSITVVIVVGFIVFFPIFLWIHTKCICHKQ